MELSMRQIFFCKIDLIQVVWEMRIFYYSMQYFVCIYDLQFFGNRKLQEIIVQTNLIWEYFITDACLASALLETTCLFACFDVSGHEKQRNLSSVVLKMNNYQEESVSSAVYKYDTSTNAAFLENFPDYREGYQCW